MNRHIHTIDVGDAASLTDSSDALSALESGQVIYLPNYVFSVQDDEMHLLSEALLSPKHKNMSYDSQRARVSGLIDLQHLVVFQAFIKRFLDFSTHLVKTLLPQYHVDIQIGRTSYRPAQIKGRTSSKRKDDTRLHVDSFAATPVNGLRILRVFSNINPYHEPRVWHLGEPFSSVLEQFTKKLPRYSPFRAQCLRRIRVTKTLRTAYDHYMLHLHDQMKLNDAYQQAASKIRFEFPAQSTWVVFTDHVSHAALSGQFLLEQTFYLPISAMQDPALSPFKQLQAVCDF